MINKWNGTCSHTYTNVQLCCIHIHVHTFVGLPYVVTGRKVDVVVYIHMREVINGQTIVKPYKHTYEYKHIFVRVKVYLLIKYTGGHKEEHKVVLNFFFLIYHFYGIKNHAINFQNIVYRRKNK